ncbi:hypothetical protein AURDEDRAFT_175784 [Auricularia subglabra TFB-10046 SS5]|uniref:F-box domain-containing protein n=1 Tax=Auricularia subglabra (strain TFB-10046 / SS5) TaxID=717982 RepID=J0WSJ8_AURST|nr:hypothetical protein AURDEDRAFT_175784 [Auricularia subglabra TFB-10046 SS5]
MAPSTTYADNPRGRAVQHNLRVSVLALPVELLLICWLQLSFEDRWRVAQVCSYWRHTIIGLPMLWNSIDITSDSDNNVFDRIFPVLLARSGNLPLDVKLAVDGGGGLWTACDYLEPHAERLRTLTIRSRLGFHRSKRIGVLFDYSLPNLASLCLTRTHDISREYDLLAFATLINNAPLLRHLELGAMRLPAADNGASFPHITTLTARGNSVNADRISAIFPALEQLNLIDYENALPRLAGLLALREVSVSFPGSGSWPYRVSNALMQAGLPFVIPGRTLRLCASEGIDHAGTVHHLTSTYPPVSLTVQQNGDFTVCLRGDRGRTGSVIVPGSGMAIAPSFLWGWGFCASLEYLSLPLYHEQPADVLPGDPSWLIAKDAALDSLQTLCIRAGRAAGCCLLSAASKLLAPSLRRVEVLRDPSYAGVIADVSTGELCSFVEHRIDMRTAQRVLLEVFIDAQNGVTLDAVPGVAAEAFRDVAGRLLYSGGLSSRAHHVD